MKRRMLCIGALGFLAAFGCFPEKRVVWSPDGRWAAVIGGDGLYLCDGDGRLTPRIVEGAAYVSWMPDSSGLVVMRTETAQTWAQMAPCFTDERREQFVALAEQIYQQVLVFDGDLDNFESEEFDGLTDGEQGAMILYMRDHHGEELRDKLGEKWEELEEAEVKTCSLQIVKLTDTGAEPGQIIFRSPDEMNVPRISPNGKALAFIGPVELEDDDSSTQLYVVSIAGRRPPRAVVNLVSWFSDWSPDGRYLVFAHTQGPAESDALRLGSIARRQVCDENGQLLDEFSSVEDLAGVVFQEEIRVRCLSDGRILFSTMEINLPCATGDMPQNASLFAIHPEKSPLVMRLVPRQSEVEMTDLIFFFEVSPDEKRVSIIGSNGELCVLTLATGNVWTLLDEDETANECRLIPTWRSADELCYTMEPEEGSNQDTIVLSKLNWAEHKETRSCLSTDWPEAVVKEFLIPAGKDDD